MQDDGELNPDPETVGWYGPPQWGTTPGETSGHPGILTGHVRNHGGKDVFWNLQGLAAGALVVVTYDDGTQAAFRTDADAVSMGKDALTHDPAYSWAWELPSEGTKLTLITCDASSGPGAVGTSTNNWAVQATRVA
nr:class F sortase [Micrococcus sp. JXJ CY 30]